jgi:5'-methylthioadenosine phosphorylase
VGRLAVVGGNSILGTGYPSGAELRELPSPGGPVTIADTGSHLVLQRHGARRYTQPQEIDHGANLRALRELDCDRVLAIGSVGGLRTELGVGTFLCPDDFVALHLAGSLFDDERGHSVPGFDPAWRARVVDAWSDATDVPLRDGGTYWQTIGPRLETRAEIRVIATHAHVVGMTLAGECVSAGELELRYCAICVVDNLANGVGERPLSAAEIAAGAEANRERLIGALDAVLPVLGEE